MDVAPQLLDGLASGSIHLHFYTVPLEETQAEALRDVREWKHPSAASQKVLSDINEMQHIESCEHDYKENEKG